ncbi:MAG: hypothetical protein ABIJ23_03935 [Candidatus Magasanikbacteria bacterium]
MSGGKNIQNSDNEQVKKDLDFVLQKFLQKANVLEGKQRIISRELEEILRQVNLKKAYHNIINKN